MLRILFIDPRNERVMEAFISTGKDTNDLGTAPIGRLLTRLAIPSSVALLVSSTYNLVDTIFVGRGVGIEAIGALTLVFPFQMVILAFGNLIGIGAASIVSRSLGAGDPERARHATGTAITLALGLGLMFAVVGRLFSGAFAQILGARGELNAPTLTYLRIVLLAAPLQILNISVNSVIRAEGEARAAMVVMVSGMLLNTGLDPLFIFVFDWGIEGAAIATVFGHALTTILIGMFYSQGKGAVRLAILHLRPDSSVVGETLRVGSSGFARQISSSLVQGVRNNLLVVYGGTVFVSAFGVVFRSLLFLAMPAMGIAQALPPVAGYNFGAGRMDRVRKSVWVSIGASSAINLLGFAVMMLFPGALLGLFSDSPELIANGVSIMRINATGMLVFAAYYSGTSFFQAIGKPIQALGLALTRPVLAIVVMLIGVRLVGPLGVVAADPIAILVGAIVAVVYFHKTFSGSGVLGTRSPGSSGALGQP